MSTPYNRVILNRPIKRNKTRSRKFTGQGFKRRIRKAVKKKQILFDLFGDWCLKCKRSLDISRATLDHVIPAALGGACSIDNLQILCVRCNSKKKAKVEDYRPQITLWCLVNYHDQIYQGYTTSDKRLKDVSKPL